MTKSEWISTRNTALGRWKKSGAAMRLGRVATLIGLLAICLVTLTAPQTAEARRYAAMVIDFETGATLFSRNADRWVYPASLTKMMTLYLVFEAIEDGKFTPSSKLSVSKRAAGMPASKLGLRAGSTIAVRDAVRALIVKSANDVAVVVAEAISGSEIEFGKLMTRRARQLGMTSTQFRNASGLPNSKQRTTARDMIRLSRSLLEDFPGYYHLFSQPTFSWGGRTYRSHNRLLRSYSGMDGLKTGYIRASGYNLAASAKRGGHRLIGVVFGGKTGASRNAHMEKILNQSFATIQRRPQKVALPRQRPVDGLVVASASPASEQGSADGEVVFPVPRTDTVSASQQGEEPSLTPVIAGAISRTTTDEMRRLRDRGPQQLMPETGPVVSVFRVGREKLGASGNYGVQVGAFHQPERARQAAVIASKRVPSILLQGDIDVSRLQGKRRPIYRARVVGLSLKAAERACNELERESQDCLVIQTSRIDLAQASP